MMLKYDQCSMRFLEKMSNARRVEAAWSLIWWNEYHTRYFFLLWDTRKFEEQLWRNIDAKIAQIFIALSMMCFVNLIYELLYFRLSTSSWSPPKQGLKTPEYKLFCQTLYPSLIYRWNTLTVQNGHTVTTKHAFNVYIFSVEWLQCFIQ